MRNNRDSFIAKAVEIYGDKYDYSKVAFVNMSTPVIIICPEHGDFERTPSYHLQGGYCPVCAKQHSMECVKRPRAKHTLSEEAKKSRNEKLLALQADGKGPWAKSSRDKAANTCIERFGAKTWAESDIGVKTAKENCSSDEVRRQMSERAKSEDTRRHYVETSKRNHGVEHWTKSDAGRQKLHDMFFTDEERKARSERMLSSEVKDKIRATNIERYGVPYYWQSEEGRARLKVLLNDESVQCKIIQTKKERGTLNSSKPEKKAYELLINKFGDADVEVQYKVDSRYPYACDFYIKSLDLFIELNASWLHGFHWFDDSNLEDLSRLDCLLQKAQEGKPMYERAIYIWTYDDLMKRRTAEQNNLNYLVFWDNDLSDFKTWLDTM